MVALTDENRRHILDQGYTVLPAAVPPRLVDAALRAINASLGSAGIDPSVRERSFCPELRTSAVITDLVNTTPLWSAVQSLLGAGQVDAATSGQIALRFPAPPGREKRPVSPHLDGMHGANNGVPAGAILNFTALVGVYLSDVTTVDAGNFTVWPGSHHLYEDYFRVHGPQSLLEGMPSVALPEPVQVRARPGDAVISHYQLGHSIAPNLSPHVRYAVYFRFSRHGHEAVRWDCMTDIWREWQGMRDLTGAAGGAHAERATT